MRLLYFRGKDLNNNWIYGEDFRRISDSYYINQKLVKKESIGQFTGMYDSEYNKIFEGDILMYKNDEKDKKILKYKDFSFGVYENEVFFSFSEYYGKEENCKVVGSLF